MISVSFTDVLLFWVSNCPDSSPAEIAKVAWNRKSFLLGFNVAG